MQSFIILFMCLFTYSLQIKPKFCINCKYFIPCDTGNEFGKCMSFQYENNNFLIDGNVRNNYYFCSTARGKEDLCGKIGKKYVKKYKKNTKKI